MPRDQVHVIQSAGTALAVLEHEGGMPEVLHWGAELAGNGAAYAGLVAATGQAVPPSSFDQPWPLTLLPTEADGWSGTPALQAHRGGGAAAPRWQQVAVSTEGATLRTTARTADGIEIELVHDLDEFGVLRAVVTVTHAADAAGLLDLAAVRVLLPLPARAAQILDLTGRWCRERSPQRSRLEHGTHLRAGRRGRTGHDATLLMLAGTPGFGFRHGEVWAAHVAWSGNHEHLVEALPEGAGRLNAVLGGAELLVPGEIRLAPGQSYTAPTVYFVHSAEGMDGISRRLHRSLRSRDHHPHTPRPVVLNTWEAVYFETDLEHLKALADTAAQVGVERFVLDDGWFGGRRHDQAGLGDWVVSQDVWPEGMHPLVDHVKGLGLQFGLWFEPEMVNADSDLVREHPEWMLRPAAGSPREWRFQQLLDLANPEAYTLLRDRMSALVDDYGIDYIKWDHNRDLHEAVHTRPGPDGRPVVDAPAVHAQTTALYRLLDELRVAHPGLEIESCASGGGRVDLGILQRTDRIWTSDCNDALERASIQRWTSLLVPAEIMGTHVGRADAHTTHRHVGLSFRLLMALQGHAGLELDITGCSPDELAAITAWAGLAKELRPLLHTGDLVRADLTDDGLMVTGTVAQQRDWATYTVARLATSRNATPGVLPLPGLDPDRSYRVRVRPEAGLPQVVAMSAPAWWEDATRPDGIEVPGAVLTHVGLSAPVLAPANGYLLELRAV